MPYAQEELKALVRNPREKLDVEIKQSIDPSTPEGIAKIAKACLALRNNDGGCRCGLYKCGLARCDKCANGRANSLPC